MVNEVLLGRLNRSEPCIVDLAVPASTAVCTSPKSVPMEPHAFYSRSCKSARLPETNSITMYSANQARKVSVAWGKGAWMGCWAPSPLKFNLIGHLSHCRVAPKPEPNQSYCQPCKNGVVHLCFRFHWSKKGGRLVAFESRAEEVFRDPFLARK